MPYDPTGAMGGLFAPAYIHGNPESDAAVSKWQGENFAVTPEMIEASRGPSTTVTNPAMGGLGQAIRGAGSTSTIPGSVDPEALQIYAQGGKYTPKPVAAPAAPSVAAPTAAPTPASQLRNAMAAQLMANSGGAQMPGYGQLGQQSSVPFPISWLDANHPNVSS